MQRFPVLTIRNEQLKALGRNRRSSFIERAADHLERFFPHLPESGDRKLLADRVRRGIEEAASYGLTSERDLIRWLNVGAALGEDFAGDPKYPWARRILESPLLASDKAERLSQTAIEVIQDLALRERTPPEPVGPAADGDEDF